MTFYHTPKGNKHSLSFLSDNLSQRIRNSPFEQLKKTKRFNNKKISRKLNQSRSQSLDTSSISDMSESGSSTISNISSLEVPFDKCISSIFDLSLGLASLADALDDILSYLYAAAICDHTYRALMQLLNSSAKCSVDVQYLILAMAILVLKSGIPPKKHYWQQFAKESRALSQTKQQFVVFGKAQNIARRNLIKFSSIFTHHQRSVSSDDDIDNDHYGIDYIIKYVLSHKKGRDYYNKWEFPDPTPGSLKRIKLPVVEKEPELEPKLIPELEHEKEHKSEPKCEISDSFFESCSYVSASDSCYLPSDNVSIASASDVGVSSIENSQRIAYSFTITTLNQIEINPVNETTKEVAKLFTNWSTAYSATKTVWNLMKTDSEFHLESLYRILPFAYSDFLKSALETYKETGDPV